MIHLSDGLTIRLDTFGTAICSTFSLIGSLVVIFSFLFVKSIGTKPRGAQIIFNLACADCIWFTSSLIQSLFWTFEGSYGEPGKVPIALCFILSPLVTVSRMSSLMWTCVIAHEAVQSVYQRKYNMKVTTSTPSAMSTNSSTLNSSFSTFYEEYKYFLFVYTISLPGGILAIAKQHSVNHGFGCEPDYEKLGEWYEIMFTELIPIICGFLFNIFAFFQVRSKMSTRAFPRSVRKRRKRVMYHYLIVCIICWIPTIIFYTLEIFGFHSAFLEVFSRVCLYTTGFFNCLVFGMQDPHISRSFQRSLQYVGLGCLVGVSADTNLKRNPVEKTVMFENAEKTNADIAKDKKTVYRYHRLSREDKAELYRLRPDLNIKGRDSLVSNESYESSSMRSSSSSYHEPLLLHHTITQIERERSIQAQAKRDRVRQISEHISASEALNEEERSNQQYRALKDIDGKIIRRPEASASRNPYYDSDSSQRPTNSTSESSASGIDSELTVQDDNTQYIPPAINISSSSSPLQMSILDENGRAEDGYPTNSPPDVENTLIQSPLHTPRPTILSDEESIFAPDNSFHDVHDSSSDEEDGEAPQADIVGYVSLSAPSTSFLDFLLL